MPEAWLPQSPPRAVLGDQGWQSCRVVLASRFGQPAEQLLDSAWCDHLQRVAVRPGVPERVPVPTRFEHDVLEHPELTFEDDAVLILTAVPVHQSS